MRVLEEAGLRPEAGVWGMDVDEQRISARLDADGVHVFGPVMPATCPVIGPAGMSGEHEVESGDADFAFHVVVFHRDRDLGLSWLTHGRRRAALRAVRLGCVLVDGRWRVVVPHERLERLGEALDAVRIASRSFAMPPDRSLRIGLHALTHDPCVQVRARALRRLAERGEAPASVVARMARETDESVLLAVILAGGARAVRVAVRMLCGGERTAEAALALAAVIRRDAYAAEALDRIAEDLLVERLVETLADEEHGLAAATALRGLYLPRLPVLLFRRWGYGGPDRARALRWEMVTRYRTAWGDTWPREVLMGPGLRP